MSVDTFVFLRSEALPTATDWQAALGQLGLSLMLDSSVDPREHSGYWPAVIDGEPAGFGYYAGTILETFGDDEPPEEVGDRDMVVQLVTGGDLRELRAAFMAAAGLIQLADARMFDEESGGLMGLDELMAERVPLLARRRRGADKGREGGHPRTLAALREMQWDARWITRVLSDLGHPSEPNADVHYGTRRSCQGTASFGT